MHPPFSSRITTRPSKLARKNVGLRPRLRWTDGDRWVWDSLPTEPSEYTRPGQRFPVVERHKPDATQPACRRRVPRLFGVVGAGEDLLAGLFHLDCTDAVVELGEVTVDLGVAAVRVTG